MNAAGIFHAKIERWAAPRAWQTNLVLLLIGFGMLVLTRQLVSEFDHVTIGISSVCGWSVVLYACSAWVILTKPVDRWTFPIILAVAIGCRLITLLPDPIMSSDVYRYAWDGVVQHARISPYRYAPGDPALTFLRQPNQDLFDNINRRDYARTIYPPGAQIIFYLVTWFNPTVTFMKLAMILFEGVTIYALVKLLRELGRRREQALLYAWCPLLLWEIGSSGHVDSAAMAFVVLALLMRYRKRPIATGIMLGAAILIKFYPLVLLPALLRRREYKMPAAAATLCAVCYAVYASAGRHIFGFLGGYAQEEGLDSGTRYFLLEAMRHIRGLHHLPSLIFVFLSGLLFAALTVWTWKSCCRGTPQTR